MPVIAVESNVTLTDSQRTALMAKLSEGSARWLHKPERYIMIIVKDGIPMQFAGSPDPCAYIECKSVGLPRDETVRLSRSLCDTLNAQTGIPKDRIYIEFTDAEGAMWGWNSDTF